MNQAAPLAGQPVPSPDSTSHPVTELSRKTLAVFALLLALALLTLALSRDAGLSGDGEEYMLTTIALAEHATPDLRLSDVALARQLMPAYTAGGLDELAQGIASHAQVPRQGYFRGSDGRAYSLHFFGYPALAALPLKLLLWSGGPPLQCFLVVNVMLVWVLALCLLRLFRSAPAALAGTALFLACGGSLYWTWSSPEIVSAAALLASLVCFCSGAPRRGGLLAGIAAMQNPTIVFVLGAAPLLAYVLRYQPLLGWRGNLRRTLSPRMLAGLAIGLLVWAMSPAFNLAEFGTPSLIAKVATGAALVSLERLHSLYFDLNQGMIVAIPGVALALLWTSWRGAASARGRRLLALLLTSLLTVAFAVPALAVHNWNSGASGVMRYAFWAAMPFVFLLLWRLRELHGRARWVLLGLLACSQLLAMSNAKSYAYTEFSPLAKWMFRHAPSLYNPESEIFVERLTGIEDSRDRTKVHAYRVNGVTLKALYHSSLPDPESQLCGNAPVAPAIGGPDRWLYLKQLPACWPAVNLGAVQFTRDQTLLLGRGWSQIEPQHGAWSDSKQSLMLVSYLGDTPAHQITLRGYYFEGNRRTRVKLNGVDQGWVDLQAGTALELPPHGDGAGVRIELTHEAPHSPGPQDRRQLAFYLQGVTLR
ncbi:hypothetical protein [Duganella violaceipulchra]|uniref:Uncharacterized protein n=1 Tax=Duganella violaceipulchra TaxID=2849652 RepID=A0AA41H3V5_9BURK|nr:hypothetical protein [Duganella violaceicalia]MBV6320422.1 hypothetical protein [Duganella violaceicalia]MCP2012257.1 hypothetical protein [Duganella violaceicalia]